MHRKRQVKTDMTQVKRFLEKIDIESKHIHTNSFKVSTRGLILQKKE